MLDREGHHDSLGYFALRDDRSVIFSPTGKAAITYRVVGGVSLAAGDPLGDPEAWPGAIAAWLAEARRFAWVPAVLAASERGAEAFHRAGLDALELGDEAILHVDRFTLDGPQHAGRPAGGQPRSARAGYRADVRPVAELDRGELDEVASAADRWRDGERGARVLDGPGPVRGPAGHRRCVVACAGTPTASCAACCTSCRGAPTASPST